MEERITSNGKWKEVEEKLKELQRIVDENWDNGDWELAMNLEKIIKTADQSKRATAEMIQKANHLFDTIDIARGYNQ